MSKSQEERKRDASDLPLATRASHLGSNTEPNSLRLEGVRCTLSGRGRQVKAGIRLGSFHANFWDSMDSVRLGAIWSRAFRLSLQPDPDRDVGRAAVSRPPSLYLAGLIS